MRTSNARKCLAAAAIASLALMTAACGSSGDSSDAGSKGASTDSTVTEGLIGTGCAAYAKKYPDAPESLDSMAKEPLADAIDNNPLLKTYASAINGELNKDVDLNGSLDEGEYTVFAPVDDAFAALPKQTMVQLGKPAGAKALKSLLTYPVVKGQLAPDKIVGKHTTIQGGKLEVKGAPENPTVGPEDAGVVCGGVKTANATIYLIDSVVMPPARAK